MLWSDPLYTGIRVEKDAQRGREQNLVRTELDVAADAATAYFDILRAQTRERIERDNVRRVEANRLVVDGNIPLEELNDRLPQLVPDGDYETLAGFLATRMQRIPQPGDGYRLGRLRFRVLKATERNVQEVEVAF